MAGILSYETGRAPVGSLPPGMHPSIDPDIFARYERRVLEIALLRVVFGVMVYAMVNLAGLIAG